MDLTGKYERAPLDHYETEEWVTRVLLRHVKFTEIWEPAVGKGRMLRELIVRGYNVVGTDIHDYGHGYQIKNFLDEVGDWDFDIVTNPPFDIADLFIHKALSLTRNSGGKVAMLLRNEFDCAAGRKKVFSFPFDMKIVLQKRPRWIDGSTGSPRHNYAWYIWDWKTTRDPVIRYDK